jgi:type VI protein secretion system component Hcp
MPSTSSLAAILGLIVILAGVLGYGFVGLTPKPAQTTTIVTTATTITSTVTTTIGTPGTVQPVQHPTYFVLLAGITGESTVLNYSGIIQLKSWDWGPPRTSCGPAGTPGAPNCTSYTDSFDFNATTSKASQTIQQDAAQGTTISSGELIGVATIGGQPTVVLKLDFTELIVSSYSVNGQGNLPVDFVTLVFHMVTVAN